MNRALQCLLLAGCSCLHAAVRANPAIERAFAAHCSACHGRDGEVNGDFDLRKFPAAARAGTRAADQLGRTRAGA